MTDIAWMRSNIGTRTIWKKRAIIKMTIITIEVGNAMIIGTPQTIEVDKPNHKRMTTIGNSRITSNHATTVRRKTDVRHRITTATIITRDAEIRGISVPTAIS